MKLLQFLLNLKNFAMNYYNTRDSRWFKKHFVKAKYFRCDGQLHLKFKDNTGISFPKVEVKNSRSE